MKFIRKILAVLFAVFSVLSVSLTAAADSFVVQNGHRVPITEAYEYLSTIKPSHELGDFSGASDIFCDSWGDIYVADTLNNRILKFSSDGETLKSFTNSAEKGFNAPEGVFVQNDGDIYVADTGNSRIVHITQNDTFIEEFVKPESNLLGNDFAFQPSKIGISSTNLIHVLNKNNYEGVFTMNADNDFCGYTCDNKVSTSIFDSLLKIFGSEYQKRMTQKRLPAVVTNFSIVGNNVFVCTGQKDYVSGKLAEYTTVGINLMKDLDYGINTDDSGKYSLSSFVDVDVLDGSIIAVLDQKNGKVFEYSQEGEQIAVFGEMGNNRGEFDLPVALCYGRNAELYVLDQAKAAVHVFRPTEFIAGVHTAIKTYASGDYDKSQEEWKNVLKYDESYTLAIRGIAKTYYKNEEYELSAQYYMEADDKEGYSEAYAELRHLMYRKYFVFIVVGAIALAIGLYFALKLWKKKQFKFFYGYYKNSH